MLTHLKEKTVTETSKLMFEGLSEYCGLAKVSHKINHHNTNEEIE
jgi:hypothetical protein